MRAHPIHSVITLLVAIAMVGSPMLTEEAQAGPDPFIGEIIMFGGNFAIRGYAKCDGQLLAISSNSALFSLLGTTYGGDGRTTFALPDLRGRMAMHAGRGPGLSDRRLGQRGGAETVTLTEAQLPPHSHAAEAAVRATSAEGNTADPTGAVLAKNGAYNQYRKETKTPAVSMTANTVAVTIGKTGGGSPHSNMPPFTVVTYLISMQGTFPSRS